MYLEINLNDRQKRVLQATVNHYVATAEPVGSKVLVEEYNFTVSTATIRSCLSYLDKSGLLYQPHTSAGRVPSDSGYRLYVDQLMTPNLKTGSQVEAILQEKLNGQRWSLESLFKRAAQILSNLSGYITLITMPRSTHSRLHHVQLIPGDDKRVMLILVTDTYQTYSTLIDLPQSAVADLKQESWPEPNWEKISRELQILSNFLNDNLKGQLLGELESLDWTGLGIEFQHYREHLTQILKEIKYRQNPSGYTDIWVSGVSELLRQPEFSQLQQVQALIYLLEEEPIHLLPLISQTPDEEKKSNRVKIWIGTENPLEAMHSCALVASSYCRGSVPVGSVGVVGPTRMMYENAIATVEATADYLSELLS